METIAALYRNRLWNWIGFIIMYLILSLVGAFLTTALAFLVSKWTDQPSMPFGIIFFCCLIIFVIVSFCLFFAWMKEVKMYERYPLMVLGKPINTGGHGMMVSEGYWATFPKLIELNTHQKITTEVREPQSTGEFIAVSADGIEVKCEGSFSFAPGGDTSKYTKETEAAFISDGKSLLRTIIAGLIGGYTCSDARAKRNKIRQETFDMFKNEHLITRHDIIVMNINIPVLDFAHAEDEEVFRLAARAVQQKLVTKHTTEGLSTAMVAMRKDHPEMSPQEILDAIETQQNKKTKIKYEGLDKGAVPFINLGGGPKH